MLLFILIIILIIVFSIFLNNKLIIRFDTFFRRGFKKTDDSFGVYCWVGDQGVGKTYSAVDYIFEMLHRLPGYKCITNIKTLADSDKQLFIYEHNFYDIIEKFNNGSYNEKYIILYDELFTLLEKGKLPKKIRTFISQLRKRRHILMHHCARVVRHKRVFQKICPLRN